MRIVVCAKEVPDPDAVNAYAVSGRLTIAADGTSIEQAAVPLLMNAYDEQAIEAALRLRDAGHDCSLTVVTVGTARPEYLRKAAALGADQVVQIRHSLSRPDTLVVGAILAGYIRASGGADLVLCGRQASDDDQGVVPAVVAEELGLPLVTMAREIRLIRETLTVVRVTPAGDETVECDLPAVVTVSSELGAPRMPTARDLIAARSKKPSLIDVSTLGVPDHALAPRLVLRSMVVPQKKGNCEFISGDTLQEAARALVERLRAVGLAAGSGNVAVE